MSKNSFGDASNLSSVNLGNPTSTYRIESNSSNISAPYYTCKYRVSAFQISSRIFI